MDNVLGENPGLPPQAQTLGKVLRDVERASEIVHGIGMCSCDGFSLIRKEAVEELRNLLSGAADILKKNRKEKP